MSLCGMVDGSGGEVWPFPLRGIVKVGVLCLGSVAEAPLGILTIETLAALLLI